MTPVIASIGALGLNLLAQADGAGEAPAVTGAKIESVWDFIVKGGPTMFALIACSLVALTIIVERAIVLRRRYVIPPGFLSGVNAIAADRKRAMDFCQADGSPAANLACAALKRRGERIEAVEKAVEEAGRREIVRLRHRMRLLGALPQVSTMLGLLGTIFGMIKTFQAVAVSGQSLGKTEMLAQGIFEAWTCTAAGLLIAIPVMIAYHILMGRIDALMAELDRVAEEFVEEERTRGPAGVAPVAAAREPIFSTAAANVVSATPASSAQPMPVATAAI